MSETTQELVYRLYIKEKLPTHKVIEALQGRTKPITVKNYIRKSVKLALERGDPVPLATEKVGGRRGGFLSVRDMKILSQTHVIVGVRLARHRTTVANQSPQTFVEANGRFASFVTLRQMEQGVHDFSLSELQKIADILGIPLLKLMEPATAHKC